MAAEAAGDEAVAETKGKLSFLDLPAETQQEIISHCQQSDLICVALVSKHFHELASAQLYRNFHIVFPDDDDINFDSPIDGLAGGLDTFTTSEYNYAKHLKDLSMDTLSAGAKGEQSYQSYLYSASCGKFLNTLLYLVLKRSKSLETFRWNIRVELSRPVYRELHRITSLKRLHIRMQAGESYYTPPPPLPVSVDTHAVVPSNHWPDIPPLSPTPFTVVTFPPSSSSGLFGNGGAPPPPPPLVPSSKSLPKSKSTRRSSPAGEPSTLSGFKHLRTLSVLDIDDLDIVTELKTCIKNSSSTLTELHLSLSDNLALQARKPPPDSDPDDSDLEDDFQVGVSSHNGHGASEPAKAFRAQEERKVQEAMLGRIFDVEHLVTKKSPKSTKAEAGNDENKEKADPVDIDPREVFITSIRSVSSQLVSLLNGSSDLSSTHQDILDTIEKASRKYVDSGDLPGDKKGHKTTKEGDSSAKSQTSVKAESSSVAAESSTKSTEPSGPKAKEANEHASGLTATDADENGPVSVFEKAKTGTNPSKGKGIATVESSPDDIDMEHIEQTDSYDDSDDQKPEPKLEGDSSKPSTARPLDLSASKKGSASSTSLSDGQRLEAAYTSRLNLQASNKELQERIDSVTHELNNLRLTSLTKPSSRLVETGKAEILKHESRIKENLAMIDTLKAEERKLELRSGVNRGNVGSTNGSMSDYVRDTRGFSLESLSLHLIPVKPSVLSKAVNLHTLKQLTLLNVGNQTPIWTMLAKENKLEPLPLRSIFTDNVSHAFLTFLSQLEGLDELFMLERSKKHKPESFAPSCNITIDQIRRLVLTKHMPTLKRLMIKDESTNHNWDANEKAMVHICTRGLQLEELAVSMNIGSVYLSHLVNLRALHILHFKNNDTCIWVMREILRFIVDNLSHHPELKLEWIGMEDDRVERVVRPSEQAGESVGEKKKKQKSKAKPPTAATTNGWSGSLPILPSIDIDSESDSDDELYGNGTKLRFKTSGRMQFYDVWTGIKIFEKEIRSGRL